MLETVILLLFCLVMGLISLAAVAWVVVSGRLLHLDGLMLTFISLTIGGIFLANFAWSVRSGELQQALKSLRKGSTKGETSREPPV